MSKNRSNRRKRPQAETPPVKYVCKQGDLDKLLSADTRRQFWGLFYDVSSVVPTDDGRLTFLIPGGGIVYLDGPDGNSHGRNLLPRKEAWRMFYKGMTPRAFLSKFGIDINNPTVRDAVALDLVKLDDASVSNDKDYTYEERMVYSSHEYERFLLNKNFRINLINLDTDWSSIQYRNTKDEDGNLSERERRTVDRMYQGVKVSETVLRFFNSVFDEWFGSDGHQNIDNVYVPFTNANDFYPEVSLIPNTHPDIRPITSRAYYDMQYRKYRKLLSKWGIRAIATFALVDHNKDKNHTGQFLVKVQKKIGSNYRYVVCKIDKDGQFARRSDGSLDIELFSSKDNTILCVCEDDFKGTRTVPRYDYDNLTEDDYWHPEEKDENGDFKGIRDIPMVKSTTSSHYSVFRQRIPEYDLKNVRNYLQFKTRLEGMELCLEQLKRDANRKEVQSSQCFAKLTMSVWRLMQEFGKNKELMKYVMKYYDLVAEYDELVVKKYQLIQVKDEKQALLDELLAEYNGLGGYRTSVDRNLDKKLELGQKIKSLRLELDKSIGNSISAIDERRHRITLDVKKINDEILKIQEPDRIDVKPEDRQIVKNFLSRLRENLRQKKEEHEDKIPSDSTVSEFLDKYDIDQDASSDKAQQIGDKVDSEKESLNEKLEQVSEEIGKDKTSRQIVMVDDDDVPKPDPVQSINTDRIHHFILATERWRGFMFNLGYELNQMKKMLVKAEDATIKVRRLVRNFKDKMEEVESQVWDSNHNLKDDFSFTGMSTSSLREIILLHDWYACNAPGKTYWDMGFKDKDEFNEFRRRCNKISYNLRKNQYAEMLAISKDRHLKRMNELQELMKDTNTLKWKDKYGWEAKKEEEKTWSMKDVTKEQADRIKPFSDADPANPVEKENEIEILNGEHSELPVRIGLGTWEASASGQTNQRRTSPFARIEELLRKEGISHSQYMKDLALLERRTLDYLKEIGLIESDEDIEKLAARNRANNYSGNISAEIDKLDSVKDRMDKATETMTRQREALQSIIDSVYSAESKIQELEEANKRIFTMCLTEKNRQVRNRLLIDKLENENKIVELKNAIKDTKTKHLTEFKSLEKMRRTVDRLQSELKNKVVEFKETIGLNEEAIARLMVGIYNRFQDEILEGK